MKYDQMINKIMPEVAKGGTEPIIIYRDADADWHCDFTKNQYGEPFPWIADVMEQDKAAFVTQGKDFAGGSMPYVYDTVLSQRLRNEYYNVWGYDQSAEHKKVYALLNFFEENISAFSHATLAYLTEYDRPLAALDSFCPFNLATGHEGWYFNEDLAADAVDAIEQRVEGIINTSKEPQYLNETPQLISSISFNGYNLKIGEDTEQTNPFYIVTSKGEDVIFEVRTNSYAAALEAYSGQITERTEELRREMDGRPAFVTLTAAECLPDSKQADFTGKLVIVDAAALKPEFRSSENQLLQVTHGNGARPNAIGRSVFGTELFSGASAVYDRSQILGIADEAALPNWARIKLEARRDSTIFEFGGYHFKPERQFRKGEVDKHLDGDSRPDKMDAQYATRNMHGSDIKLPDYSHTAFYAASKGNDADIFRCLETGKLYVPHENELFRYNEPPVKEQVKSSAPPKPAKTAATAKTAERAETPQTKPSILDDLDASIKEADELARRNGGNHTKKRGDLEVD